MTRNLPASAERLAILRRKTDWAEEQRRDPKKHRFVHHPQSPGECWICCLNIEAHGKPGLVERLLRWLLGGAWR